MSFSITLLSRMTSIVCVRKRFLMVIAKGDEQENARQEDDDDDADRGSGEKLDVKMLWLKSQATLRPTKEIRAAAMAWSSAGARRVIASL